MHTDMEWRPKARLGDLRGRKNKRERHNLLGVAPANQKYRLDAMISIREFFRIIAQMI